MSSSTGLNTPPLASQEGCLDVVKYLITEQQMEPLCEDEYGNTPLHRACAGGHEAVVEFLTLEIKRYAPFSERVTSVTNGTPLLFMVQ